MSSYHCVQGDLDAGFEIRFMMPQQDMICHDDSRPAIFCEVTQVIDEIVISQWTRASLF
jgi:hypothetical protein